MANMGEPNTTCGQFYITLAPLPWLDGKRVVCGRVIDGVHLRQVSTPFALVLSFCLSRLATLAGWQAVVCGDFVNGTLGKGASET